MSRLLVVGQAQGSIQTVQVQALIIGIIYNFISFERSVGLVLKSAPPTFACSLNLPVWLSYMQAMLTILIKLQYVHLPTA